MEGEMVEAELVEGELEVGLGSRLGYQREGLYRYSAEEEEEEEEEVSLWGLSR